LRNEAARLDAMKREITEKIKQQEGRRRRVQGPTVKIMLGIFRFYF